jgi:hypothetical protein
VESRIWIVGAACGENETSGQHPAARSLIVSHDRSASPCRGSDSRSRPQAAKRWRVSATAFTDCRWSGLFSPSGLARYRSKLERMALGSLKSLMSWAKRMAGRFLRRLLNLNQSPQPQLARPEASLLPCLPKKSRFSRYARLSNIENTANNTTRTGAIGTHKSYNRIAARLHRERRTNAVAGSRCRH